MGCFAVKSVHEKICLLAKKLTDAGFVMATAESCTGGGIAQALTDISGSSQWFDSGIVTYSNEAKQRLLGVPSELINKWGAVSEVVAKSMAEGAVRQDGVDLAVAVTGIAGPTGGTKEKPVGTVWIAWKLQNSQAETHCYRFDGDRSEVRQATMNAAITGLLERL
jgi:nicotinamide-nucleotide amidase